MVLLECVARAAPIAAAQPVDLRILAALIGDDESAIADVLQSFRQSAEHSQEVLANALASNAVSLVAQTAHNLKSAARAIGASRLGEICAVIEEMASARKTADLRSFFPQFRTEMNAVSMFLESRQQM